MTFSISQARVCGPVNGLKRTPMMIPTRSRNVLRPLWSSLPWIRFAAVRISSTASLQVVLNVLVGRGTHRRRGQVAVAEQLGVDVPRSLERFLQVVVQLVVVQSAVDIRLHRVRGLVEPFLGLGHPARPFLRLVVAGPVLPYVDPCKQGLRAPRTRQSAARGRCLPVQRRMSGPPPAGVCRGMRPRTPPRRGRRGRTRARRGSRAAGRRGRARSRAAGSPASARRARPRAPSRGRLRSGAPGP